MGFREPVSRCQAPPPPINIRNEENSYRNMNVPPNSTSRNVSLSTSFAAVFVPRPPPASKTKFSMMGTHMCAVHQELRSMGSLLVTPDRPPPIPSAKSRASPVHGNNKMRSPTINAALCPSIQWVPLLVYIGLLKFLFINSSAHHKVDSPVGIRESRAICGSLSLRLIPTSVYYSINLMPFKFVEFSLILCSTTSVCLL